MSCSTRFSDIAEVIMGQSPKALNVNNENIGLPLLNGPTEFSERHPVPVQFTKSGNRFAEKGDILFCVRGSTTGRMNYADQRYAIGRGIGAIRGTNGFPTPYVRAVLEQNLDRLLQAATGSTFPNVSRDMLNSLEVNSVGVNAAKTINRFLVALEDKVYLNSKINQTLEQIAQALFKSWFVDFDPVKAKISVLEAGGSEEEALLAAMQVISSKNAEELEAFKLEKPYEYAQLQATAELFPAVMVESELGEIPEGWEARPFGGFLSKTIGGDWGKEQPDKKHTIQVKIIRGTDIPKIYFGDDSNVPDRFVEPKKLKTRQLETGDIIIEVSGGSKNQPTGRSLFFSNALIKRLGVCEPASFCRLFRPANIHIGLILGLHLQHIYAEGKTWLYQNQSTGISNFQTSIFLENELVVTPSKEIKKEFFKLVMPLLNKIHSNEHARLAELRDTLLPKLLSGELTVFSNEIEESC